MAEADKVNGADGDTPTNRHPGSRQREERNPCVSSEEEPLWETELHTQREKKDDRRVVEKKESDDVGTRQERGGQGSVRVGGQAALNMEADGAKTPEGKGERVCREDKKG